MGNLYRARNIPNAVVCARCLSIGGRDFVPTAKTIGRAAGTTGKGGRRMKTIGRVAAGTCAAGVVPNEFESRPYKVVGVGFCVDLFRFLDSRPGKIFLVKCYNPIGV